MTLPDLIAPHSAVASGHAEMRDRERWPRSLSVHRSVCILPKFKSGNGTVVHLVGTVGETHGAHRRVVARQPRILGDAGATKRLNRLIDDFQRHIGGCNLD